MGRQGEEDEDEEEDDGEVEAGRLPLWMGLAGVQASSNKQQAPGSKPQASSIKQQPLRNRALRLWQEIKKSMKKPQHLQQPLPKRDPIDSY